MEDKIEFYKKNGEDWVKGQFSINASKLNMEIEIPKAPKAHKEAQEAQASLSDKIDELIAIYKGSSQYAKAYAINQLTPRIRETVLRLKDKISVWTTEAYFKKIEGIIDEIFGDKLI